MVAKATNSRALYWALTALFLVALVLYLIYKPEWCWVTFPPLLTSFALAMDAI